MQDSDEETDELSATKYISTREALTPATAPRQRKARRWGRRMASPFDAPASSADLDEAEDEGQEEEEEEILEEAASGVSSELDPSVTNPVRLLPPDVADVLRCHKHICLKICHKCSH